MKDKYELRHYEFYEDAAIAAHLEKMDMAGWRLERMGRTLWRYRRAEPQRARYAVTYFSESSKFNPVPTENEEMLREYCAAAGWQFVCGGDQMLVFRADRADVPPIETEECTKLEATHKAMKKSFLPSGAGLLALIIFQIIRQCMGSVVNLFSDGGLLAATGLLLLAAIYLTLVLALYARWYFKSKASVARGGPCLTRNAAAGRVMHFGQLAVLPMFLAAFIPYLLQEERGVLILTTMLLGVILLEQGMLFGIRALLKRRGVDATTNRVATVAISFIVTFVLMMVVLFRGADAIQNGWLAETPEETYTTSSGKVVEIRHDDLPLTVEELGAGEDPHYSYKAEERSTPFLELQSGSQRSEEGAPEMDYRILDVRAAFLYQACLNEYLSPAKRPVGIPEIAFPEMIFRKADPSPWGAEKAWQYDFGGTKLNRYLLCKGKRIVWIDFDWVPSAEQMKIAGRVLLGTE
jgi:hypothetical protein